MQVRLRGAHSTLHVSACAWVNDAVSAPCVLLCAHPCRLYPCRNTFISGAPDNIKEWYCEDGKFIQNLSGHNAAINALAINQDGVLVSGADNGSLSFWDYRSGYRFQQSESIVQPGWLDSEAGIYAMTFDKSGSRLITCEADETIKFYKEVAN